VTQHPTAANLGWTRLLWGRQSCLQPPFRRLLTLITIASTLLFTSCTPGIRDEAALRRALATGTIVLPAGVIEIHSELTAPENIQALEIRGQGPSTILRAAPDFHGRAIISVKSGTHIRLHDFVIEGARDAIEQRLALPPYDRPFAQFFRNNGILLETVTDAAITHVRFHQIAAFPILVTASKTIRIDHVEIENSGSRNLAGRNNTTGGILFEEGTTDFQVTDSGLKNIRGNGIWTHSLYTSPRNADGLIARNAIGWVGRDAIQVGHATRIRVENNIGEHIGYPESIVDIENKAVPVAIDTAGNTDQSVYSANQFVSINGKCIDLDGFHHGEVTGNFCGDMKNFGIVMNNTNPDMKPDAVTISDNTIQNAAYGGIFVIGSDNKILRNKLINLNQSKCETCLYVPSEPDMLRSGIYLGRGADRPAVARGNVIEDNEITGFHMTSHCVGIAPTVSAGSNKVERNRCSDVY